MFPDLSKKKFVYLKHYKYFVFFAQLPWRTQLPSHREFLHLFVLFASKINVESMKKNPLSTFNMSLLQKRTSCEYVLTCHHISNISCMFLNPNIFLSNLNSNCSDLLDLRNLQEQVKKAFRYQNLFWPFTVWINRSSDLKFFSY